MTLPPEQLQLTTTTTTSERMTPLSPQFTQPTDPETRVEYAVRFHRSTAEGEADSADAVYVGFRSSCYTQLLSMDRLPIEIIFDILHISGPNTIATFLRTASMYRDAAQSLLYHTITLQGPEALQGLLQSLTTTPRFASRIRHLVAHWDDSETSARYSVLTPLLEQTVNLESLVLQGFYDGIHLLSPLVRLREVQCDCFPHSPEAVSFFNKIPNLRSIILKGYLWPWTNISPVDASLENIWTDVLKKVTFYSGPLPILALLPKGTSLKHIQTTWTGGATDALNEIREATDRALISFECIPLPLHPPSFGLYLPSIQFLGMFHIMTIPPQPAWSDKQRVHYLQYAHQVNNALFPILAQLRQLRRVRFWAPHIQPAYPELYDHFVEGVKACADKNLPELCGFTIWSPNASEHRGRFMRYTRHSLADGEEGKSCGYWVEEYDPRQVPIREEV